MNNRENIRAKAEKIIMQLQDDTLADAIDILSTALLGTLIVANTNGQISNADAQAFFKEMQGRLMKKLAPVSIVRKK